MGSYRSAADRASDQAVLTAADRPPGLPALDSKGRANWLSEGETITYWTRLPHGAVRRIASASTHASVDDLGHTSGTYDVGTATLAKYAEGIVAWTLTDGAGLPVLWDPRQAAALLDGVPDFVLGALGSCLGNGEPPPAVEPEGERPQSPEDEDRSPNA